MNIISYRNDGSGAGARGRRQRDGGNGGNGGRQRQRDGGHGGNGGRQRPRVGARPSRNQGGNGRKRRPAVVLPLDGSQIAVDTSLGAARAMTRLLGGVLHIVHVTRSPAPEAELPGLLHVGPIDDCEFQFHQISGKIVNSILEFAMRLDARLLVMSSHGRTNDPELLAGSTTMELIQNTIIPVLVVRPDAGRRPGPVWQPHCMLVPLNGSPVTGGEVEEIYELGRTMGVEIDVLHVAVMGVEAPAEVGAYTSPAYLDYPYYDWMGWSEEFIRRFGNHTEQSAVRLYHHPGNIVDTTLAFAQEHEEDMIALIWHGTLDQEHAHNVRGILERSDVPVLLKRVKSGVI